MIQVDGLSREQLSRALNRGEMPFLLGLLKKEGYRLHTHYSGMPSSTPAVQGELFFGVRTCVPAFSFMDRKSGQVVRMFDPMPVAGIEAELKHQGKPLLRGGSAYSDALTGGAAEPHFCPSALGLGSSLRSAAPLGMSIVILYNVHSFLRTAVLLAIELVLAVFDCASGVIDGCDLMKELKFVPTRVAICILLRELVTIGAKIDIARGLPVIHVNFLGYDEQAHRRGPSSRFAHWALKGIDDAIARIWRAARRSVRRDYDVWIYSDHGQEDTAAYPKIHGRTAAEAVAEVFEHLDRDEPLCAAPGNARGVQFQRARLLGGKRIQKLFPLGPESTERRKIPPVTVTAMGPLGFVYASRRFAREERDALAKGLVELAKIPLVLVADSREQVRAWTREGEFELPRDRDKILGPRHPFLDEVTQDLISLCRHPKAGDFVICGWQPDGPPYTFPIENGSHGGPGAEETQGFALLPADTPLPERPRDYLRPTDLRRGALHRLGDTKIRTTAKWTGKRIGGDRFRVLTYNVHSCIGMDGKVSPDRIARVIAQCSPDIVALQELDVGRARTKGVNQARLIAQTLQMAFQFHPVIRMEQGLYGNAVLTHFPMKLVKARRLPGLTNKPRIERRGALWAAIDVGGRQIQFINTHLGLRSRERRLQVEALLGLDWLHHPDCLEPVILCGDFNALPYSWASRHIARRLRDAQVSVRNHRPLKTWFGRLPAARIDHVFVGPGIEVLAVNVSRTGLARVASDHLPLMVDLRVNPTDLD